MRHKKWQYKVWHTEGAHSLLEATLNVIADEGWELAYSLDSKNLFIFRKPAEDRRRRSIKKL